jgi:hypothetical protein
MWLWLMPAEFAASFMLFLWLLLSVICWPESRRILLRKYLYIISYNLNDKEREHNHITSVSGIQGRRNVTFEDIVQEIITVVFCCWCGYVTQSYL